MKKLILMSLFSILIVSFFSACINKTEKKSESAVTTSANVEVYYFHFSRRCVTCVAVETESQKALATLYPKQMKEGIIAFKSVNLDDNGSKTLAEKCKAEGLALVVMSGSKRIDLTYQSFLYAKSKPAKLKLELKNTIDPLLIR